MSPASERAILAGGCFWGMQELIRQQPGVLSTRVGYSGGDVPNATYRHHGSHAEAIEIIFDPARISYRQLLEFFFQIHDPSTPNRQGNDRGSSYRSAIYYTTGEQERVARETLADVDAAFRRYVPYPELHTTLPLAGPATSNTPEADTLMERDLRVQALGLGNHARRKVNAQCLHTTTMKIAGG